MANTIRIAAFAALVVLGATSAQAIERINTNKASCASIQQTLVNRGEAILRYPSKRNGMTLYDRYVGDSRMCDFNEVGVWASVPSKSGQCRVIACQRFEPDDLFPFGHTHKPRNGIWLRLRVGG